MLHALLLSHHRHALKVLANCMFPNRCTRPLQNRSTVHKHSSGVCQNGHQNLLHGRALHTPTGGTAWLVRHTLKATIYQD